MIKNSIPTADPKPPADGGIREAAGTRWMSQNRSGRVQAMYLICKSQAEKCLTAPTGRIAWAKHAASR